MRVTDVTDVKLGDKAIGRCRDIAAWTSVPSEITRTFLSAPMRGVHGLVRTWMLDAGMAVHVDAIGNIRGLYPGLAEDCPRLVIGSHLDTVPNAGAFDGILGVVLGIMLVEGLGGKRLPFAIEVVGFSEEEGVRFSKPFLGSMALAGNLDAWMLELTDAEGVSVGEAIRGFGLDPLDIPSATVSDAAFAYLEIHIEQGPVLESLDRPLGVVETIIGQSRLMASFMGKANHAGTTPMRLRHDALAAAAEWITAVERTAVEREGLVATVGSIRALPGAANVIPGEVSMTLDLRHPQDSVRFVALESLLQEARQAADRRGVAFSAQVTMNQKAVPMDGVLTDLLEMAVANLKAQPARLASGAGHDAMVIAGRLPSCMLFVRSPGGLSHHPDESVLAGDVEAALDAGMEFLKLLSDRKAAVPRGV